VRNRLSRAWRAVDAFSHRPAASFALVGIALLVYAFVSLAFSLGAGRDLGVYLRASFELRQAEVVLPQALLTRAPVPGVVAEALLVLGPVVAEATMAILYALSVLCWWRAARRLGTAVGVVTAVLVLAYPGYVLLFHRLSSDGLYAAAFALAALLTARLVEVRSPGRAAALGGALALLVLVRPVSQILVVLAPLLLVGRGAWRPRFGALAAFGVAAAVPILLWAGHNVIRADDLTVVRGGGNTLPFFRAFVVDRIVEPGNGPASRELAAAVERELLTREPYRSYGVGVDDFFSSGSGRLHEDLVGLADRRWGWHDDYRQLSRVAREAVVAHPGAYVRGVLRDTWRLLWWPVFLPVSAPEAEASSTPTSSPMPSPAPAPGLPPPTEGELIPAASVSAFISTPDGRFREVWVSPTEHTIVADDPDDAAHLDRMNRRVAELFGGFSERQGSTWLGEWLNRASRWFPRSAAWLLLGLLALAVRRPPKMATPLVLTGAALLVIVATSLAVPASAEYSAPVAPTFVLLAVAGLLAPRGESR
jgi:hypothetical protein